MRRESNSSATYVCGSAVAALLSIAVIGTDHTTVRAVGPTVVDPNLTVDTVVSGLSLAHDHGVPGEERPAGPRESLG